MIYCLWLLANATDKTHYVEIQYWIAVLYQVLNEQVPVPVRVPVDEAQVAYQYR